MALTVGQNVLIWPALLLNNRDVDMEGGLVSTASKQGTDEMKQREAALEEVEVSGARITALQTIPVSVTAINNIGDETVVGKQDFDRLGVTVEWGDFVGGSLTVKGTKTFYFAGSNSSTRDTHAEEGLLAYPEVSSSPIDTSKLKKRLASTKISDYGITADTSFSAGDFIDVNADCEGALGSASTVPSAAALSSVGSGDVFRGLALDDGENWSLGLKANYGNAYVRGNLIYTAASGADATTGTYAAYYVEEEYDDHYLLSVNPVMKYQISWVAP